MENSKTLNVLIVDDSRVSRMLSRGFVHELRPDWIIEEADSGEQALEKVAVQAPDLVLMDVNMPGMGGFAAAKEIKAKHPGAHICILTANVQEAIRLRAKMLGIEFAEKPITQDTITKIIAAVRSL